MEDEGEVRPETAHDDDSLENHLPDENQEQYEGDPMGSQYTSEEDNYPLEQYEEYEEYDNQYPSNEEDDVHYAAMRVVEDDSPPQHKIPMVSLGTMEAEQPSEYVSRSTMNRVAGQMTRPVWKLEEIERLTSFVMINGIEA
jgi:hypothetical protein